MTDALFDLPESKSPRLEDWIKKNGIQVFPIAELPGLSSPLRYVATKQTSEGGETEEDALRKLAKTLNIEPWDKE